MEESEKRKERLKAIRLQASSSSPLSQSSTLSQQTLNSSLSNPFLQNPPSNLPSTPPPPRFDYYTDPMSAFKDKTSRFSPSFQGPRNPEMRPVGAPQSHHNYTPHQGMHQSGHSPGLPGPTSSPMGFRSPFPMHQGDPNVSPGPGRGSWFNNYSSPGLGDTPYPVHQGNPNFRSPQARGHWPNSSPSPGPGRGVGHSPGRGRGGGPSPGPGRGRGQWQDNRTSPNSGYLSGRGRGRGGSYHNSQGRSFYNRSMVEDPWESLTPVLWQGVKENDVRGFPRRGSYKGTPPFHKTPFQKTPIVKKPRVSDPFVASNSKQSLAEFLSESFDDEHEAVEDQSAL